MSIKKLFDSTNKGRNYLSETDEKEAFSEVESSRNVRAITKKQDHLTPQIDFSEPANFVKYGSAYLYYKSAIEHVYGYYPYDGSDAEITEYYNNLLGIEKYIYNNLYPKTNGYINLSAGGWGTRTGALSSGYGMPTTTEYIKLSGGPHTASYTKLADAFNNPTDSKYQSSNLYEENVYLTGGLTSNYASGSRISNLQSNFNNGVTVEFWLKKDGFDTAKTEKEVVFDMWNNNASSSVHYGRLRVELTGAASGSPFLVTVMSGTSGVYQQSIGQSLTTASLSSYGFYSLSFYNNGTDFISKLYVDGALNDTYTHASNINTLNPKGLQATIGALITSPSGSSAPAYAGKLSASMDEFRFWKDTRDSSQIARYYRSQVRGGTNTDISNTTLGVYFKFNEGITGTSSIDSTVLDYSGRLSNGSWAGYATTSRNTGSMIVLGGAETTEYLDPIIYPQHPQVASLQKTLEAKGTGYDANNNSTLVNLMPSWVLEEAEKPDDDVRMISHIVATYFDKLALQIEAIPKLKHTTYTSASHEALPFAHHLPQSLGLYSPEIFVESEVMERFLNRSQDKLFQNDLAEVKNLIYLNLYNSLAGIYKAKGTEKAVRNVLRCFNIDDRIIKLKTYTDGQVFRLKNNLELTVANNSYVNLNNNQNLAGVVFQRADSSNPNSLSYISGTYLDSREGRYGFTAEASITFPRYEAADEVVDRSYISSSLFGMCEANTSSADNTAFLSIDNANFQVHAVRDQVWSKNVYFRMSSSNSPFPFPELTSSTYFDVYDNNQWHFSVRLKPSNYPISDMVTGSDSYSYILEFRGTNAVNETIQNVFKLTASVDQSTGASFLKSAKRMYVGAQRTNVTGALVNRSDINITNLKYWTSYLNDNNLNQHLYDLNNAGISGSYKPLSPLDPLLKQTDAAGGNTLGLHWTFGNITGSDSSGNFYYVSDMSSGSSELRDNYGWVGGITGYQHTGYGYGFKASSADAVMTEPYNTLKFIDPESVVSSEMISIVGEEQILYGIDQSPPKLYHVVEKSMYQAISEEMLTFFAGVIDFNNVIGDPVNRYRGRYKALEKLREVFFRKVTETSKVEKFIEYYRWLDDAIAIIISQLMPASAGFVDDAYNIVESHVLERNKYRSQYPTIDQPSRTPEAAPVPGIPFTSLSREIPIMGINELLYNWRVEHAPISSSTGYNQNEDTKWWLQRANRSLDKQITSGDPEVDRQREIIRVAATRVNAQTSSTFVTDAKVTYQGTVDVLRTLARPYKYTVARSQVLKGGVNFQDNKNIAFTYNALRPDGPVNTENGGFVPLNVMVAFTDDLAKEPDSIDNLELKTKTRKYFKVQHGRDYQDGLGYSNVKSSYAFPFNVLSSSVVSGYNKQVVDKVSGNIEITNAHNDVYGEDMEVPMQGPFANYAVGGHQSRHVAINKGPDTYLNRPEAWKILLDTCTAVNGVNGGIGMAGPDYPWPEANAEGETPYPMTGSERAVYYRDFTAKTPYVFKNILMKTGSTILGNYQHNYQVVSTVGAYANPRAFVENPPVLPTEVTQTPAATQGRTILGIRRADENHFEFTPTYAVPYFHDTSSANKSVIRQRFSSPGGIETIGQGYGDIRSDEYSVYNTCNYKNLTLLRPFQNMSGTVSEATGTGTPGIRVADINGQDFGLRFNLTQHAGRFGRNSLLVTNPGASYDQQASLVKDNRNPLRVIKQTDEGVYHTASQYDNFWVQHQIPRSDRQYAWVTNSLAYESLHGGLRYWGYAPTRGVSEGMYSSSATGYTSYFGFVTASSVLGHAGTASIYQPALSLNIYVAEPVDVASNNTLGFSTTASVLSYYNAVFLSGASSGPIQSNLNLDADFFNLVMTQRKSTFGYRGNPQTGPVAPTVLRRHRRQNTYSFVFNETTGIEQYTILPISNRSQPMLLNLDIEGNNETLQQSYNLEHSYFGNEDLDQKLVPNLGSTTVTTAGETIALARSSDSYNLNWIIYRETLFPAAKNQFLSSSSTRVGYDNLYWRNSELARYRLTTTANLTNTYGTVASQSCWPLDAPLGFLTRSNVPTWLAGGAAATERFVRYNSAGELQNEYVQAAPMIGGGAVLPGPRMAALRIGALYSRKHMLGSPFSVVAPSGMQIPQTGAVSIESRHAPFEAQIQLYAGSALWEAGSQAGIVIPQKVGSTRATAPSFQTASSLPWFNNYADFEDELGRISKGFAVVPEFRISEHLEDYEKYGINTPKKYDTFEIVGTTNDSADTSFYKDFSNSDFMSSFADIRDMSLLDPRQILLTCTASIRLNPYKGFYPAQRTTDLVKRFADSYGHKIMSEAGGLAKSLSWIGSKSGSVRPLANALFAPGILYNTIKAGIAVDYPVVGSGGKIDKTWYGTDIEAKGENQWMLTAATSSAAGSSTPQAYLTGGVYWDDRLPFESIITPTKYLSDLNICDLESHPSCSIDSTASLGAISQDPLYTKMASNFFGEIGNFFLKDSGYTKLESGLVRGDLRFSTGSIYGARIKLRRTMSGSRFYNYDSGSSGDNRAYSKTGAKYFNASTSLFISGTSYPLPQDPRQLRQNKLASLGTGRDQQLQENFTLYSRPSAFGPPIAGRPNHVAARGSSSAMVSPVDGVAGFNWAHTPPYYHGEAWADLIFTPDHTQTYDLEKILSEVQTVYWRADPGPSSSIGGGPAAFAGTQLLPTFSGNFGAAGDMIYDGKNINGNSMQLSASLAMFGVQPVFKIETDAHGDFLRETNEVVGKKWVIQPKMETPHFNFNDVGVHPISADYGTLSVPLYGSGSVPRGMWHQFGIIEPSGSKGIFMEIQDIPKDWLRYHYDVRTNDSVYNKNNASLNGGNMANSMKSLTDIGNFKEQSTSARLGELATHRTIKEAIVAIPYVQRPGSATELTPEKEFFKVSQDMVDATSPEAYGTKTGDSLDFAGQSVRKLVQKMQDYILPPQFDFLNNPSISPMVMYFFEFAYSFDKDDLSYIWQNLAPRDYKKMKIEVSSTGHVLAENELLSPEDVLRDNVRWMVFKVKQRSQKIYDDLRIDQAGQASTIKTPKTTTLKELIRTRDESYPLQYNWPYDYVSFVEGIKFGASVQYTPPPATSTDHAAEVSSVAMATGISEAHVSAAMAAPGVDSTLYDAVASTGTTGADEIISALKEVTPGALDIEEARPTTPASSTPAPTARARAAAPPSSTTGIKKY